MKPKRGRHDVGTVETVAKNYRVLDRIEAACAGKPGHLLKLLAYPVHVGYLGGSAGYHYAPSRLRPNGLIELHEEMDQPGREKDFIETFIHEVGHALDHLRRGTSDHGPLWRKCMADLGAPNEPRCHSMNYLRASRRIMKCDNITCQHTEGTRAPETQAGRRCSWCGTGRMQLTGATS